MGESSPWLGDKITGLKGLVINEQSGSGAQKPPLSGSKHSADKPSKPADGSVPMPK